MLFYVIFKYIVKHLLNVYIIFFSYYASTVFPNPVRLSPQVKRPRLMSGGHQGRTAVAAKQQQAWAPIGQHRCQSPPRPSSLGHQFKIYSKCS